MKKQWLVLLFLNILLGLVVFFLFFRVSTEKQEIKDIQDAQEAKMAQSLVYPFFPVREIYLDEEKLWQVGLFQPIFNEFIEDGSRKYLMVSYKSENGELIEGKIKLSGSIPYVDSNGEKTLINVLKLKEELKVGERFGINYLVKFPENYSTSARCIEKAVECFLADFKQISDAQGEKIFYPLLVYRILKQ